MLSIKPTAMGTLQGLIEILEQPFSLGYFNWMCQHWTRDARDRQHGMHMLHHGDVTSLPVQAV